MNRKLLITGSGGLVGYALKTLHPKAVTLTRRDGDLTDRNQTRKLFKKYRPVNVIHLAAKVGGVKTNAEKNADMLTENILINTNVLSAAQEFGVQKLVAVLSSCIFAESDKPLNENQLHSGLPFFGNLGYGMSKRFLDIHTHLMHQQYRAKFTTITPVTIYGPNDNFNLQECHVISALIHKCYLAKKSGLAFEVWGTGNAIRQFVFSFDVAKILLRMILSKYGGPRTTIIAPDSGMSIKLLATTIAKVMNYDGDIIFNSQKPEGQKIKVIESKYFSQQFPNFQFTPIEEGLEITVKWFLQNYKKLNLKK